MKEIRLPERLRAVADKIPQGCRLSDVGTDHALLPLWLIQQGRVSTVIASDLRTGPLQQAAGNAARYKLSGQLELRHYPGLEGLLPEEAEVITICGMGGETIKNILEAAPWTREKLLILEPQSNQQVLRRFLSEQGYRITEEDLCEDRGYLYQILTVTGESMPMPSPAEAYAGVRSCWTNSPLRKISLERVLHKLTREAEQLNRSTQEKDFARRDDLNAAIPELRDWLKETEEPHNADC